MTVSAITWRKVEAKGLPTYKCNGCGATATGSTVRAAFELEGGPALIKSRLEAECPPHNTHMPDGWSGSGRLHHLCPECQK